VFLFDETAAKRLLFAGLVDSGKLPLFHPHNRPIRRFQLKAL
jgi:hypothetical protein